MTSTESPSATALPDWTPRQVITGTLVVLSVVIGFLLAYRAGWNLGIAAVVVNVVASLLLVPVAVFIFKDQINWVNILGILVCLAGLVMLNWKR